MKNINLALFEWKQIRRVWDEKHEKWYFSVVDVVWALSESKDPRNYWKVLKNRLISEWSETVTKCNQLKLLASDWKMRLTDVADTENMFRIIQSIPSPNAEPFKLWLAKVWYERIEESEDPELAINRALNNYLAKWYSEDWINQRLKSIEVRKQLTNEWKKTWVLGNEYAILTDDITKAWAWISTREYKDYKWLKKENLRDNMTNLEIVLNMLAEATTTEISKTENPNWLQESRKVAKRWWNVAWQARKNIEKETWKKVISKNNNLGLKSWEKKKLK